MIKVRDKNFEKYILQEEIQLIVRRMAAQISEDYQGKEPLIIPILNGSFMFAGDLMKHITIPCEISFIKLASYEATQSKGEIEEILGLNADIKGRHIIIVEDIVDTGLTMHEVLANFKMYAPASMEVATFLHKPKSLKVDVPLKYVGKEIGDKFVVGYGLDYNGFGRNLQNIYVLAEDEQIYERGNYHVVF
jgi:hypoxanthine phosphoribosyltransferase